MLTPLKPRTLTTEEKAALWDEVAAYQNEINSICDQMDKLRYDLASKRSQRDALFARGKGMPKGQREVCSLCNFETCVCERIG